MNAPEAEAIAKILEDKSGAPDPRSWGEQFVELSRVRRNGAPEEQARRLQKLYRLASPDNAQLLMIDTLEEALFPALSKALRKPIGTLRSRFHRGNPAFGPTAPERPELALPKAPEREGWEAVGAFRVWSGQLALGEGFASAEEPFEAHGAYSHFLAPASDGVWFHYQNDVEAALAVHESAPDFVKLSEPVCCVRVAGGTIPVVDAEVRLNRQYQKDIEYGGPQQRACIFSTGGDGATPLVGITRDGRLIAVGFNDAGE